MRIFLFICLGFIFIATPAQATSVSKEMAEKYYQSCNANTDPNFTPEIQDMFCACTAAQLMENYTVEDMQDASQQNQAGRNATNKMITEVYAPCIQYPARQYHYNSCIKNPQTQVLGTPEKICECSADLVANYLQRKSKSLFRDLLKQNPNIMDPMQALYDDPDFQKYAQNQILGCVGK